MKRPKKKEHIKGVLEVYDTDIINEAKVQGFNECHDLDTEWLKSIISGLDRIRIPLQGDYNEWGKKELADIINTKANLAQAIHDRLNKEE